MLIGHYRADRPLGDGVLGKLYEGVDSRSLQRVVIRVLGRPADDKVIAQLQTQARALGQLQLEGIVGILDCQRLSDGSLCIISPRAKGQSLDGLLAQLAGRPWPLAQQLGQQLAGLLLAAQQLGVSHLALRPSQILVPSSDQALGGSGFSLLGLGLAAALGRTWVTADGLPIPPFAAPEQHADVKGRLQPVDERADVFALGVLLWQAFLGSNPFPVRGPYQGGAPTFALGRERPAVAIVELLTAMVETSPRDRPPMSTVAKVFDSLAAQAGAAARPAPAAAPVAASALAPGPPSNPEPEPINDESLFLPAGAAPGEPPDPNAGLIFGNFQTVRKIGEGGMGIVYEARHRRIGRRAAIKIMHKELAQNEEYAARFLNEARAVNIIQHRGLVEISEYGKLKDGTLFIVIEYLQGQSLWDRFTEKKKFGEAEVTHLAVQIARALAAAHEKGIVHRDLKPENIMLVPDPVTPEQDWVKILDFGIAKVDPKVREAVGKTPKRRTQAGSIMGTPDYMAPEQFGGAEEVDGRADVFSLGVILYELLAGEPPYTGTPLKLLKQAIRPLGQVCPSLSRRLVTLIDRMLAVDAAKRPTMAQVAQELSGMRSSAALPRVRRLRRRLLIGAAAAAAALLGGGLLWWLLRSGPPTLAEAKAHALAVLEANLRSERLDLQLRAIGALANSGDLSQRTLLEPLLHSRKPQAVEEAAHALGQIGAVSARPALLALLQQPHPTSLEITVADALSNLKEPEGLKMLTAALDKDDPEFKLRAATLLLDHGSLAGAPALWERIGRANLSERASLITIGQLAQAGDGRARQLLQDTLAGTTDSKARLFAAFSLAKLGDGRGRAELTEAAAHPGAGQLLANQLLAALGETSGSDLLTEVARSAKEPDDSRELAISGLADCGREDSIALLDGLLDRGSTSEVVRIAAAGAILRLIAGERTQLAQQSLSWAKAALASDSAVTRELATASLGELSSDETVPPLGQALRDRQREVRRTAARALGTKSVRAALDALAGSLDDQDIEVRAAGMRAISRVVRSLRQQGKNDADRVALSRLKLLARDGSEADRVVASGILVQLGEVEQQGRVRAALGSRDALVRKLAVEMADGAPGLFERALKDPDRAVRLAAARRLADQGSHLGVAILQEAVRGGDLDGLTAYGKLKKLGETVAPPEGLAQLLQSADLQARLDVLDAAAELPGEQALALLYLASHDFAAVVRRRAAEVAGGFYKRTGNSAFLNLIKIMLHDADALVRAGAAELLLTLPKPTRAAAAVEREPPAPPASTPERPQLPGGGQLRFVGDGSVRVQVDRGAPQVMSSKPVAVSAGKHRVSYVGGTQELEVAAGETVTVTIPTTYAEQLLHDGVEALQARRLDRAQDYLERIRLLEQRGSVKRALLPDIAFNLGRVYEDKRELGKALQEYGRLRAMAGLQSRPELRAGLDKAMGRLAPLIGHIVLSRRDRSGRCIQVDVYLPPGTHSIDLGLGKPELVRAQAGVTTRVDKCPR